MRYFDRMRTPPGWDYRRWWWMQSSPPPHPDYWATRSQTDGIALRAGGWIYMLRWRALLPAMSKTAAYTVPFGPLAGRVIDVDRDLVHVVLDRLNALPVVDVHEVCSGHGSKNRGSHAYLVLQGRKLLDFETHLDRLSVTEYTAHVEIYRSNGEPATWKLRVEREQKGVAPDRWWYGLVDALEDEPDCNRWMLKR